MSKRTLKAGVDTVSGFGLKVFSSDDLDALHYATLEILGEVGVKVESEEALEIFHGAGANVERIKDYGIVRFPHYIIEECIRWAPRTIVFHGRDPKNDYAAEPGRVGFTPFGECIQIIDPDTGKIRPSTKNDLAGATRICDYLEEIAIVERTMGALDQDPTVQPLHNYEAMVANTSKHCILGFGSATNARKIIKMAAACVGGIEKFRRRPIVTALVCPSSPLILGDTSCEVIIECARSGLGITIIPMALSGATSTVTLAGTLVTHNAEVLSSLALAQLTARGTPCLYAGSTTIMDLKTGTAAIGVPEYGVFSAGLTKLAQYYKLPSWMSGGNSDSKIPDTQAAYESGLSATVSALAGANIVFGAGCLESGLTFDYAKLIMDAEQIKRIQKVIEGIKVTDETIAIDVIKEVGPGGEFMSHSHTFNHMKSMSQSQLFDRRNRNAWMEKTGGKDLTERAYEKAKNILKNHKPAPLPEGASKTMRTIVEEYEEELGIK